MQPESEPSKGKGQVDDASKPDSVDPTQEEPDSVMVPVQQAFHTDFEDVKVCGVLHISCQLARTCTDLSTHAELSKPSQAA